MPCQQMVQLYFQFFQSSRRHIGVGCITILKCLFDIDLNIDTAGCQGVSLHVVTHSENGAELTVIPVAQHTSALLQLSQQVSAQSFVVFTGSLQELQPLHLKRLPPPELLQQT